MKTPAFPSSSQTTGNFLPAVVGVDTVAVSLPCRSAGRVGSLSWNAAETVDPATGEIHSRRTSHRLELGDGFFNPRLVDGSRLGPRVELEFSVPRWLRGTNNVAASVGEVRGALADVGLHLRDRCEVDVDVEAAWLRRVDLVRDFSGATNAPALLLGLSRLAPAHRKIRTSLHTTQVAGQERPSCLVRQTTEYLGRVYDKSLESSQRPTPAPDEHVRFELQLRGSILAKEGLRSLQDLERAFADGIAKRYFRRLAFDREVLCGGGMESALRRVSPNLTDAERKQLPTAVGLEVLRQFDVAPVMCDKTLRRHEALLTRLSLRLPVAGSGEHDRYSLDFDRGVAS